MWTARILSSLVRRIGQAATRQGGGALAANLRRIGGSARAGNGSPRFEAGELDAGRRGKSRITDFGLAGIAANIQGAEVRAGTPAYMAPEQLAEKK